MNHHFFIEKQISEIILKDNGCSSHFEYKEEYIDNCQLVLTTYNPIHDEKFIAYRVNGKNKLDAIKNLLDLIEKKFFSKRLKNYSVEWIKIKQNKSYTSYFVARDIEELLKKFYFQKNKDEY